MKINEVLEALKSWGFNVDENKWITGNKVEGMLFQPDHLWRDVPEGHWGIAVDHKECFDKVAKCPVICDIEKLDRKTLGEIMEYMGTKDAEKRSNEYELYFNSDKNIWQEGYNAKDKVVEVKLKGKFK